MTRRRPDPRDAISEALRLRALGIYVIDAPPRSKNPGAGGRTEWQHIRYTERDICRVWADPRNLSAMLGDLSNGIAEIDSDTPEACAASTVLAPPTEMRHARQSTPGAHKWYWAQGARSFRLKDIDGQTLVELRANGKDGKILQTIVPPSIHESGEQIYWEADGQPTTVDAATLERCVYMIGAAALVARRWPAQGSRHDAALALSGFLLRAGMTEQDAACFMEAVAVAANDPEHADRMRTVPDTGAALKRGDPVTGGPNLAALLRDGAAVVAKLRDWLGLRPDHHDERVTARPAESQATILVRLTEDADTQFVHDGDHTFAVCRVREHRETYGIRSKGFRLYLTRLFYENTHKAPTAEALQGAVTLCESKARFDGDTRRVCVRIGEDNGNIYLDLCDDCWRVIEVTAAGWRVLDESPVLFRRPRGMLALPAPADGGCLDELRNVVNVATDDDFTLVTGWLVGALRPRGPYPVLGIHGEQGSAKSTLSRLLRNLVDPNVAALRSEPRDARDLIIAATNGWVIALDNVSHLLPWLSDALCRLATGGGFGTRELYTDSEEVLFDAQRPILLNGITEVATRADLLDRSLLIETPRIAEDKRRTESELMQVIEAARPRILGALLNAAAAALRNIQAVQLDRLPRMADFAVWSVAADPERQDAFLGAYTRNRAGANDIAIETSEIGSYLFAMVAECGEWEGTAAELLRLLNERVEESTRRHPAWPKSPRGLSGALRRIAPNLRAGGIMIDFVHGKRRTIALSRQSVPATVETVGTVATADNTAISGDGGGAGAARGPDATVAENPVPPLGADGGVGSDGQMRGVSGEGEVFDV